MNFLIIDSALDKINFFCLFNNNSYNKSFEGSKSNNEKFSILLFDFLNEYNIILSELEGIFINQGPGKFSLIRTSIATVKALSFTNKLDLYGFNLDDLKDKDYMNIIDLYKKKKLTKNLIKAVYSS